MKEVQPTKQNGKILADVIASRIKKGLDEKKNAAQDLIDSINTKIIYR